MRPATRTLVATAAAVAGFLAGRFVPSRAVIADARAPDLSRYDRPLEAAAAESGVDPHLLRGLVAAESGGRATVVSRAGAVGLLQLTPEGAADAGKSLGLSPPHDLLDPTTNLRLGARLLALRLADFGGDTALALAAYNAGKANVLRWRLRAPDVGGAEVVAREAYAETRRHVVRTQRFADSYRAD